MRPTVERSNMRKKRVLIGLSALLILFALWVFIAPYQKNRLVLEEKELPISKEALLSHIENRGWGIADSAEGAGGGLFHTLSDGEGSYLVVGSYEDEKKRSITIQAYPGRELAQEDEKYIVSLLCELYGVRRNDYLLKKLEAYQSKKSAKHSEGAFCLVEEELVFQALFAPSETEERQRLVQVSIFDPEGAEFVSASARNIVIHQMEYFGVQLRTIKEPEDLQDRYSEENKEYEIIEVQGSLSNIRNARQADMPSFTIPYKGSEPFVLDYEKADLLVGGQKLQVLIKQRIIEKEKLKKERTHYLFRKIESNELVVFASVRTEEIIYEEG